MLFPILTSAYPTQLFNGTDYMHTYVEYLVVLPHRRG